MEMSFFPCGFIAFPVQTCSACSHHLFMWVLPIHSPPPRVIRAVPAPCSGSLPHRIPKGDWAIQGEAQLHSCVSFDLYKALCVKFCITDDRLKREKLFDWLEYYPGLCFSTAVLERIRIVQLPNPGFAFHLVFHSSKKNENLTVFSKAVGRWERP